MRWPWTTRAEWRALAESRLAELATAEQRLTIVLEAQQQERALTRRIHDNLTEQIAVLLQSRADAEKRYEALALQVVDLKRAEAGLPPAAFDATLLDPMNSLGPKTQLAVDEFAAGDPEMKKYLVGRAHLELAALRGQNDDMEAIDKELADKIRRGDQ